MTLKLNTFYKYPNTGTHYFSLYTIYKSTIGGTLEDLAIRILNGRTFYVLEELKPIMILDITTYKILIEQGIRYINIRTAVTGASMSYDASKFFIELKTTE